MIDTMTGRLVSPTIVGRERELAVVTAALDRILAGTPTHLLIAGEAGVGKSRLTAELTTIATARGMRVLAGGCANIGDGGLPFGPIVDALRGLVRDLDPATLEIVVDGARGDLARLVPALGPTVRDASADGATQQARLFEAVLSTLGRLAAIEPVVVVVEDLHWADPSTRDLVAYLVRQLRDERVGLVMTFRADELHRRHPLLPWLAELERTGRVERLELPRLDLARTRELVATIRGSAPTTDEVARIHERSDGNPFFIEELLMAGPDEGAARLPPTLRGVLVARIAALPEPVQAVVGVAAVAGRTVDHELLAAVAGRDEASLLDALRTAVASQVLVTGDDLAGGRDGYGFRHALLQEAAYEDLLPGERQRLHRAFGEALAARTPDEGAVEAGHWAELAYHWAAARDERRAFEAAVRAGTAAGDAFAFVDARRHLEAALERWTVVDDPEALAGMDRFQLLERAADAAWLGGDLRRAVALRREAVAGFDQASDPVRAGILLERLARSLWSSGDSAAALVAAEGAVAIMPSQPPTAERARILAGHGQILMLLDHWAASRARCEEAIAMAQAVGARQAEGHARNTLGLDLAVMGDCQAGIASLREALAIAHEVGNADDIGRAHVNLVEATMQCGDPRGALAIVHEAMIASEKVGVTGTYGSFVRENGITIAYELGEWAQAMSWAEESDALGQRSVHQQRYLLAHWLPLLVSSGDPRAATGLETMRGVVEGAVVESQFNAPFRVARSEAFLWAGEPARALAEVETGLAEVASIPWHGFHVRLHRLGVTAAADLAEVARAGRDGETERTALEAIERLRASLVPLITPGDAGLAADRAAAEVALIEADARRAAGVAEPEAWADAASRWDARDNPYLAAVARWHEAEARSASGDRAGATTATRAARAVARRLGARPLLGVVEALAARARLALDEAASGQGPEAAGTAPSPGDPFGLTAREREVLPLLVAGLTNRRIAETLFISESTAGVHVGNILGKLGASTRTEAATIAVRLRLVPADVEPG
jgi:DNA-binding CsgD family transcriptional regulator/tetratricopeptide (TPR) repeat protein